MIFHHPNAPSFLIEYCGHNLKRRKGIEEKKYRTQCNIQPYINKIITARDHRHIIDFFRDEIRSPSSFAECERSCFMKSNTLLDYDVVRVGSNFKNFNNFLKITQDVLLQKNN